MDFEKEYQILIKLVNLTKFDKSINNQTNTICYHNNQIIDNDIIICINCGEEINYCIKRDKEWRFYGYSDNRTINPNRCQQIRKNSTISIFKDIDNLGIKISHKILNIANQIYINCTNGKIKRGNSRKGIVSACIYHAYKKCNISITPETLIKIFNISKRECLSGLKFVSLHTQINYNQSSALDYIDVMMKNFDTNNEQILEVKNLLKIIEDKSSALINSSRPQSIAAGVIYYWILVNQKQISLNDFKNKVKLSELTINKIIKNINIILNSNHFLKIK